MRMKSSVSWHASSSKAAQAERIPGESMADEQYAVKVPKDLEDLVPMFMLNRKKEIENLRAALAASNFEEMRQIGHRMKGSGRSYGFAAISEIGKRIEEGARGSDGAAIAACLEEYGDYLDKVVISYE